MQIYTQYQKMLTDLPLQTFDQMTNGHTTGNGMRVDYYIWRYTFTCEWHILKADRN